MAYSPLFHEVHSYPYLWLCLLCNEVHAGARLTRADILRRLGQMEGLDLVDHLSQERLAALTDAVFSFDEAGRAVLAADLLVPHRPTADELRWLKTMLTDPAAAFLLPRELREKLCTRLADVPAYPTHIWQAEREQGDDLPALQTTLASFWQALTTGHMISYVNIDGRGKRHAHTAAPCRLEYDAQSNRFRAIVWDAEEARAVKLNLRSIRTLHVLDAPIPADTEADFRSFLEGRRRSFRMRVLPRNNAVARCFMIFASYEKEAAVDSADGSYLLTIHYYDFDYEEVRRHILSLGAAAIVLAPEELRSSVAETWRTAWQRAHSNFSPMQ
ncbi:WYL domain-containing protein [Selenomonas sp. oral taxon 138]|uniref:WYL domain-containing protein n=1 Tax=Selenomonas sp. oral taxon 138 TaxID=712532 RepID=UPI0002A30924|nr:WYL domain-containing protein [Selenomonas sp. oral taxon 138]EKX95801.1 hypothetical protein HMPREF9163_02008 [Selenomonas sp. oral taxon 138 str. F0429]